MLSKLPLDQQDIYFTPEYYSTYENTGYGKAKCFVFYLDDKIALYPFLINSVNSKGFSLDEEYFDIQGAYGYNGIITNCNDNLFISEFYKNFDQFCLKNNVIAEFLRFHPLLENYKFASNSMGIIKNRETISLDITKDINTIWIEQYNPKNRNKIRKAHKNNFKVKIDSDINLFYNIYKSTMKRIDADSFYFLSFEYFKLIEKELKNNSRFLFVYDEEKNCYCAMILFIYKNYSHYHLSGRNPDFNNNCVNNFILDEAVKISQIANAKTFHLGGGMSNHQNDTLFKFKSNFSKDKNDFYIGKRIHNKDIYEKVIDQWRNKFKSHENYDHLLLKYYYS